MNKQLEKFLLKVVKYGLYTILLTPLAFWSQALFPYLTLKFLLFQVLVEVVFGAWALLVFFNKKYRPEFNWLMSALGLFIVISFLSALLGIDFSRSFWGIGARMTGLFAELHFLAWLIVLVSMFRLDNDEDFSLSKYLNFSLFISILVALTAFYENQKLGLAYGYGIFNNPTFSAPYLLFHFWWSLSQILNSKLWKRIYFLGASGLFLFVLFLGQIRGSIIGLLAGILFFGLVFVGSDIIKSKKLKYFIVLGYILIFLVAGSLLYWRKLPFIQNSSFFNHLTDISFSLNTAQTRLLSWQVALKGFKDRPWLGVGPENFNYLFNAHYDPKLAEYGGGETWMDKPHNAFLEILTETGITGSAGYVFIWLSVAVALFKLFKRSEKLLAAVLGGAFISYFGTIFFSFESFGSWFGLFLFLAILASRHNPNVQIYPNNPNIPKFLKSLFVIFGCIVISGLLYVNYSIWGANMADAQALRTFSHDTITGVVLFKKSLNYYTPYKAEYQFDFFASIAGALQRNLPLPSPEDTINFVLDEADKAVAAHPKNAAYWADMANLYSVLGEKGRDAKILGQAETYGKTSLGLSPQRQETMFYLARISLLKGDNKQAIVWTRQALDADTGFRASYWYLGLSYMADNQKNKARDEIKKAMELGYIPRTQAEVNLLKNLGL